MSDPRDEQLLLVDRYVQGDLTGDELERFEMHLLEHPEILDDIRVARAFNAGLRAHSVPGQSTAPRQQWHRHPLSVAVMLVVVVSAAFHAMPLLIPAAGQASAIDSELQIDTEQMRSWRHDFAGTTLVKIRVGATASRPFAVSFISVDTDWRLDLTGIEPVGQWLQFVTHGVPSGSHVVEVNASDGRPPSRFLVSSTRNPPFET